MSNPINRPVKGYQVQQPAGHPVQFVPHQVGGTIYINLFDEITVPKVKAIMALCTQLVTQQKPDKMYFLFSSPGGQVQAGITLHHFLRSLPLTIIMHNIGSIDSIAGVIFLAGKERYASPGTSFLFHGVGTTLPAQTTVMTTKLAEMLSHMREDEKKITAILSSHTSLTREELAELFRQGEAKDLDFARDKGIIHAVRDMSVPRNAQLLSLNLQ